MEVPLGWCDEDTRVYDARTFHITVKQTDTGGQTATANVLQLSSDSTYTYGVNAPYYQWGRKDPMLPSNGMGNIDKPYYDNQYNPKITFSTSSTKDLILYPNTFNLASGNPSLELWNKGNVATALNNNTVYKTIYSPSPSNYVEPKSAAYSGFTISNVNGVYNKGWNFYCQPNNVGSTIFFAALGYIFPDIKTITNVGYSGHYWSSGKSSTTYGRYIDFYPTSVTQLDAVEFYGLSLRPVSE